MVDTIFCLVSCGGGGRPGDGGSTYSDDDCLLCSLSPTPSPSLFLPRKRRRGEERECGRKPSWLRLRVGGGRREGEGGRLAVPLSSFATFSLPSSPLGEKRKGGERGTLLLLYVPPSYLPLALLSGGEWRTRFDYYCSHRRRLWLEGG